MKTGIIKCPNCGLPMAENIGWCSACGHSLGAEVRTTALWVRILIFVVIGLPAAYMGGCGIYVAVHGGEYSATGWLCALFGLAVFGYLLKDLIRRKK